MVWTLAASGPLIAAGWTGPTLLQAIKTNFNAAFGVTHYDEVLSVFSTDSLIYQIISDPGKAYGTAYIRFAINYSSSPVFRVSSMTAFNTATDTATNESTVLSATSTPATTQALSYRAYTGPEGRLFGIHQSSLSSGLWWFGWLRPQTLPAGWDEGQAPATLAFPPGAGSNHIAANGLIAPATARYRSGQHTATDCNICLGNVTLSGVREVITPFNFSIGNAANILSLGPSFYDLASVAASGLSVGDIITVSGQQWMLIEPNGGISTSPSIAMRIA